MEPVSPLVARPLTASAKARRLGRVVGRALVWAAASMPGAGAATPAWAAPPEHLHCYRAVLNANTHELTVFLRQDPAALAARVPLCDDLSPYSSTEEALVLNVRGMGFVDRADGDLPVSVPRVYGVRTVLSASGEVIPDDNIVGKRYVLRVLSLPAALAGTVYFYTKIEDHNGFFLAGQLDGIRLQATVDGGEQASEVSGYFVARPCRRS